MKREKWVAPLSFFVFFLFWQSTTFTLQTCGIKYNGIFFADVVFVWPNDRDNTYLTSWHISLQGKDRTSAKRKTKNDSGATIFAKLRSKIAKSPKNRRKGDYAHHLVYTWKI